MSNKADSLGDRIKSSYENTYRFYLPRRTNAIIRLDMKAGHSYCKNLKRPFDDDFMEDLNSTAIKLAEEIQGCKLIYVQSDEISILVTDYDDIGTMPWFGNNIQKMVSVSASIATSEFNKLRFLRNYNNWSSNKPAEYPTDYKSANFDSRIFIIPELAEVANYFLWRSQDCSRNSIQMVARSLYSHNDCENKNCSELQDMMIMKGLNWNDLAPKYKRGRIIIKQQTLSNENSNWVVDDLEDFNFIYWYSLIEKQLKKELI